MWSNSTGWMRHGKAVLVFLNIINLQALGYCACLPENDCNNSDFEANNCNSANCSTNGDCMFAIDGYDDYLCSCYYGYTGSRCEVKLNLTCEDANCLPNQVCVAVAVESSRSVSTSRRMFSSYMCACAPGYAGENCDAVLALNCSEKACENGRCVLQDPDTGNFHCECEFGYTGALCNEVVTTTQASIYYGSDPVYSTVTRESLITTVTASGLAGTVGGALGGVGTFLALCLCLFCVLARYRSKILGQSNGDTIQYSNEQTNSLRYHASVDSMTCIAALSLENEPVSVAQNVGSASVMGVCHNTDYAMDKDHSPAQKTCLSITDTCLQEEETDISYPIMMKASTSYGAESFDMKFVDHAVMTFDADGGCWEFENCSLSIPQGAIPQDKVIAIEIGVSMCTELATLLPLDLQLVSPIIQLCVLNEPKFRFAKPVVIQIEHCIALTHHSDIKSMNLHFLKSMHNLPCFHPTDGEEEFEVGAHYGTLVIDHFCSFCISANKGSIDPSKVFYYVISVIPKQILKAKWEVAFCITLYTCSRIVEKQYGRSGYTLRKVKMFRFDKSHSSNPYMEIHFERELKGGWNTALQAGNKIKESDIDFTQFEPAILRSMEDDHLYPPRYIVSISGTGAHKAATLTFTFRGSMEEFSAEVLLEPQRQREEAHIYAHHPSSYSHFSQVQGVNSSMLSPAFSLPNFPTYNGANDPPTHLELMNRIAASVPNRWRDIGLQLGLRTADLDSIEMQHSGDCNRCFSCVFSTWEKRVTRPFTWRTILQALTSPLVAEYRLAEQTRSSLVLDAAEETPWMWRSCSRSTVTSDDVSDEGVLSLAVDLKSDSTISSMEMEIPG